MFNSNEEFFINQAEAKNKLGILQCQNCSNNFNNINNTVNMNPVNRMNLFLSRPSGIPEKKSKLRIHRLYCLRTISYPVYRMDINESMGEMG